MPDFTQSPFFGPLGAPISQEQAMGAVAPPQPNFRPGPQGGPQINPQAGQPTLPPGIPRGPQGPIPPPQGPAGGPPGPAGPGGGVGAFLGSPGMASANTALNNISAMRRGRAPGGNPSMVYGEERRKNAILQERKLRNLEDRRQNRKREDLLALQTRQAELGIEKAEQGLDPFHEYKTAIDEGLIDENISLADFKRMQSTRIDPGAHAKSLGVWEATNPPPNGDYSNPQWQQARSEALDRIIRPLAMVDLGGKGTGAYGPRGLETVVTPEMGTEREAALAGAKSGAQETARTAAMKAEVAPMQIEGLNQTIGMLDALETNPYLKDVYGVLDAATPTVLQTSVDVKDDVSNIVARLVLSERDKLKGQGTISDFESKMLASAATKLSNYSISEEAALKEVGRVREIMRGALKRAQDRIPTDRSPDGSVRRKN